MELPSKSVSVAAPDSADPPAIKPFSTRFWLEWLGNSAHFPIANIILELVLEKPLDYLRAGCVCFDGGQHDASLLADALAKEHRPVFQKRAFIPDKVKGRSIQIEGFTVRHQVSREHRPEHTPQCGKTVGFTVTYQPAAAFTAQPVPAAGIRAGARGDHPHSAARPCGRTQPRPEPHWRLGRLGGRIWAKAEVDKGATFSFMLD